MTSVHNETIIAHFETFRAGKTPAFGLYSLSASFKAGATRSVGSYLLDWSKGDDRIRMLELGSPWLNWIERWPPEPKVARSNRAGDSRRRLIVRMDRRVRVVSTTRGGRSVPKRNG
jgi:hypothetical protein